MGESQDTSVNDITLNNSALLMENSHSTCENSSSWARLLSVNPIFPHVEILDDECLFGRSKDSNMVFDDKRISSKHCRVYRKKDDNEIDYRVYLDDYSSNGTFVNRKRVGKGNTVTLVNGNEISLSSTLDPNDESRIIYVFQDLDKLRREEQEELKRIEEEEKLRQLQQQLLVNDEGTQILDDVQELLPPTSVSPIKQQSSQHKLTPQTTPTKLVASPSALKRDSTVVDQSLQQEQQKQKSSTSNINNNNNLSKQPSTTTTTTTTTTATTSTTDNTVSNLTKDDSKLGQKKDNKRKHDDLNVSNDTDVSMSDNNDSNNNNNNNNSNNIPTATTSTTTTTTTTSTATDATKKIKIDHDTMEENLMCGICQDIIYKCLTLIPCLHNYCMCCYGDWRANSVECPTCRVHVASAQKNHAINNVIDSYLSKNPDKKRDPEELKDMDSRCKLTDDMLKVGKLNKSKKTYYDEDYDDEDDYDEDDEEDEEDEYKCTNCTTPMADGYLCPAVNPPHNSCSNCYRYYPKRTPPVFKDKCEFCNRIYCESCANNAYTKFVTLEQQQMPVIPPNSFSGNQFETKILSDYLTLHQKTVQQLYGEVITQLDQGIIPSDQVRAGIAPIKKDQMACNNCAKFVFSNAVFGYRKNIPKDQLPPYAQNRDNCYYGKNCRTQFNKFDHAKKLNHVCEQSKFN